MSSWTPKYTPDERKAIEHAGVLLRIRPLAQIGRLAAAGELRPTDSAECLPPFEIPYSSVRQIVRAAEQRLAGKQLPARLAKLPPRDQAENLQRRLVALVDWELERLEDERRRKPKSPVDAEQLRKIGRAIREIATLPDPSEKRLPRTPGESPGGGAPQTEGTTRDDMAGRLLRAADTHSTRPADDPLTHVHDKEGNTTPPTHQTNPTHHNPPHQQTTTNDQTASLRVDDRSTGLTAASVVVDRVAAGVA